MIFRTRIISIGTSQGIRIPKLLLEQSGLQEEVELKVEENRIVIQAVSHPRRGWDEAFFAMAQQGDDVLFDSDPVESRWDEAMWKWPKDQEGPFE